MVLKQFLKKRFWGTNYKIIDLNEATTIEKDAFNSYESLEYVVAKNVNIIGIAAFFKCKNLQKVDLNDDIDVIEHHAFFGCEKLKTLNIKNINSIEFCAFAFSGINIINVDNSKVIGPYSFAVCDSLLDANFGKSERIENGAFYNCLNLDSVNLPKTKENISCTIFEDTKVNKIFYPDSKDKFLDVCNSNELYNSLNEKITFIKTLDELLSEFNSLEKLIKNLN